MSPLKTKLGPAHLAFFDGKELRVPAKIVASNFLSSDPLLYSSQKMRFA
jgi:hypothetical protein